MLESVVEIMARRFLREQNITLGLSLVLFVFMFLPTFLILVAVILFFVLAWPRLRGSNSLDREQGVKDRQPEAKQVS
jgi:cell division septal protein FtsQ